MNPTRRVLMKQTIAGAIAAIHKCGVSEGRATLANRAEPASRPRHPIAVSTYSFWHFQGRPVGIAECINNAAALGFDGVEVLLVQMQDKSNSALQKLKRQAHSLGLALMGLSTHQGFVSPDLPVRQAHVRTTLDQIEIAYRLGIPTMRINTGRWGTIASFDDLMAKKESSLR
jgi:sugar phosphate isomerase/epimerase